MERTRTPKPWETTQPLSQRDRVRAKALGEAPRWYNPWVHLGFPSLFGITAIVVAGNLLHALRWWEWLSVPLFLVLINVDEWYIHRFVLHQRRWPLETLFWRHTPEHHVIFIRDDMAMRSTREFRLVLIPASGIVAIFVSSLPITAALWFLVSPNVAAFWVACSMGYTVLYEWLHLAYHLPADHPIARLRFVHWLGEQHALHHTPELMRRWNFNVTVPFADWLFGTTYRGPLDATTR